MTDCIILAVYLLVFFVLCAFVRYTDSDDIGYGLAVVWPLLMPAIPLAIVVWIGVKAGDAIKAKSQGGV